MFSRWKQYRQFRKEVDKTALKAEAVARAKEYFKQKKVPNWTHEYQYNFATYVTSYMRSYIHAYAKRRLTEINNG